MSRPGPKVLVLALWLFGCDDRGTGAGSPPPTTMSNAAAAAGMNRHSYLAADGGPHLLLPVAVASSWSANSSIAAALSPNSDYGRACAATASAKMAAIPVGAGSALVFANPPLSAWGTSADGLVEVYDLQSFAGPDLDALLDRATTALATPSLTDTGIKLHLEAPDALLLFAGDTPSSTAYGVHRIPLPAGTYRVLSGTYTGPGELVAVYRLQRSGS